MSNNCIVCQVKNVYLKKGMDDLPLRYHITSFLHFKQIYSESSTCIILLFPSTAFFLTFTVEKKNDYVDQLSFLRLSPASEE